MIISEIARKANVSGVHLYDFVDSLAESGFLVKKVIGGRTVYSVSVVGRELIRCYDALLAVDNPNYPALQELAHLKSHVL